MGNRVVAHIGPCESRGGMAVVIERLANNPPKNWSPVKINTHSDSNSKKIFSYFKSRFRLKKMLKQSRIDLAHVHVTHGLSWWRKLSLMKIINKFQVPTVVHIHSGKFEEFCAGLPGKSVRRNLDKPNTRVVLLEERWLSKLGRYVPKNTVVIRNFSEDRGTRKKKGPQEILKLLQLSRGGEVKGTEFSKLVFEQLKDMGIRVKLDITGSHPRKSEDSIEGIEEHGWVGDEKKASLIDEADFLLSPSKYEGSSMSVIEAIVCGLPPIVSEASIETAGPRLVVPLEDPKEWALKIRDFSKQDEYESLKTYLKEIAVNYHEENAVKEWGDLYDSLLLSHDGN